MAGFCLPIADFIQTYFLSRQIDQNFQPQHNEPTIKNLNNRVTPAFLCPTIPWRQISIA